MAQPEWYSQLKWQGPYNVQDLNLDRRQIPDFPGCYAFTLGKGPLLPGEVLYVGEAKTSLRGRLASYLIDWRRPASGKQHKGKGFVLAARKRSGDHAVFVRWVRYGAAGSDITLLESSLIDFLAPQCNDRDEAARVGLLGDWEKLDPRLID